MDWDEDELPPETPAEIYANLRRSLQRQSGFELHFVVCDRTKERELIDRLGRDIREKSFSELTLERTDTTLLEKVKALAAVRPFDVLFVRELEAALLEYEDTKRQSGWNETQIYRVDWRGVPPILQHLNWSRENLRDKFPCAFVFFCRPTTIQYLTERAPDFFDWRLGIYRFPLERSEIDQRLREAVEEENEYKNLTETECITKLLALQDLMKNATDVSQRANLALQAGKLNLAAKNYGPALIHLAEAVDLDPTNDEAWRRRGNALRSLGRNEEAISSYDRAIRLNPEDYDAWKNRGFALDNLGRYEEAISSYDRAIELKPDFDSAWLNRGSALWYLGRYEEVIASYDRVIELKPDFDSAWYGRGIALDDLGRYEEAISSYDRAIELKPDYDAAWNNRGIVLGNLGRYEEAIASYDRAIKLNPDKDSAWYNRGIALRNLGRYEDAIASYDRAIKLKPDDDTAWYCRGVALLNLGLYEEAIASYDRAIELNPDDHSAFYNKACCYALQGNIDQALENLQRAIELNPDRYRELAKTDTDFDPIRADPRFQILIQI